MDPISIASFVATAIAKGFTITKALQDAHKQYKNTPLTIVTIATKTSLVSNSLEQLQALLLRRDDLADSSGNAPLELVGTIDIALEGCMMIFSCLEIEIIEKLSARSGAGFLSWRDRFGFVWDKDSFKVLLENLRDLQIIITGVLGTLQMNTLLDMKQDIRQVISKNRQSFNGIAARTRSIRSTYPTIRATPSLLGADDRASISASLSGGSRHSFTPSETTFDFDHQIINTATYRRQLARMQPPLANPSSPTGNTAVSQETSASRTSHSSGGLDTTATDTGLRADTIRGTGAIIRAFSNSRKMKELNNLQRQVEEKQTEFTTTVNADEDSSEFEWDGLRRRGLKSPPQTAPEDLLAPYVWEGRQSEIAPLPPPTLKRQFSFSNVVEKRTQSKASRRYSSTAEEERLGLVIGPPPPVRPLRLFSPDDLDRVSSAQVFNVYFNETASKYAFLVDVVRADGRTWQLQKYYEDFYDLQTNLLRSFPDEAGLTSRGDYTRTLPYMPGPLTEVTREIADGRRVNLDRYLSELIAQPPHVSRCTYVTQFLAVDKYPING
ncbi:hypothetical protein B0T22DRAFT_408432 [Podospora appendiculata]|uniref:PX domain-containing protein n=1 Tax=Podospora appendiculata TaxID=314037 RepID=A0AAE0XB57_9PEZI|nr:hypothetical protein B0T22DRAFT_408432 [Podospora appendiculata]